jgi:hypothetical protein
VTEEESSFCEGFAFFRWYSLEFANSPWDALLGHEFSYLWWIEIQREAVRHPCLT